MEKLKLAKTILALPAILLGCTSMKTVTPNMNSEVLLQSEGQIQSITTLRLLPGADVKGELEGWCQQRKTGAASILSAVGSLKTASIRFADNKEATTVAGPLEIVSLSGLLSIEGLHIHLSVSDSTGKTVGGHLAAGAKVYTTVEIVLATYKGIEFKREQDARTGYKELFISNCPY